MGDNKFISIEFDLAALDNFDNALQEYPGIMAKEFYKAIRILTLLIQKKAVESCPKLTGRLRASIHYRVKSWAYAYVGTSVEYAPHIEFGTSAHKRKRPDGTTYMHPGMDPQPFLEPAYVYGKEMAEKVFKRAMANALAQFKKRCRS